ncbi:MAG: mdcG [Massilia sp.]|nr:mdcG [Massilia sp.]
MFSRHDLVWLSARGWDHAGAGLPPAGRAAVAAWGARGWPAVVTRPPASLAPGQLALGIALPPCPDGSKPRIAIAADALDIVRATPAMALAAAAGAAPAAWRTALAALDQQAAAIGLVLRVYGSLALQAVTGQAYLRAGSDIDLLLQPATRAGYRRALALLADHARGLPLDGECVFGDGCAVAWKELAACTDDGARVLAKSLHGVALVTVGSLLASLGEEARCMA